MDERGMRMLLVNRQLTMMRELDETKWLLDIANRDIQFYENKIESLERRIAGLEARDRAVQRAHELARDASVVGSEDLVGFLSIIIEHYESPDQ